jgi:hypothetical protein
MKSVFRIDGDPIRKFIRTHRINWAIALLIGSSIALLLFLDLRIFLFIAIFLLPSLIEKRVERVVENIQPVENDKRSNQLNRAYLLSNFNPFTIYQVFVQLLGQLYISFKHKTTYPTAETYTNACTYTLPFEGEWFVANGGPDQETSHSWEILSQRYAYDFIICDSNRSSYAFDGSKLEHYYCFGQKVLSPADGVVVQVKDTIKDYAGVATLSIDWKTLDFRGNHVVIRHGDKEYSFIAHLKRGSISVKKGDCIKRGQVIGLCGNSGHSTEPHIHYQLQEGKSMWFSMSLPIKFSTFSIRNSSSPPISMNEEYVEKGHYVTAKPHSFIT